MKMQANMTIPPLFRGKSRCGWLWGLCALMALSIAPAHAETPRERIAARQITITHYTANPQTGQQTRQGAWPWLDLKAYYGLKRKQPFQPTLSPGEFRTLRPSGDMYIVTLIDEQGDLSRQDQLYNGLVIHHLYSYTHQYFYDLQKLGAGLRAEAARQQSAPAPDATGAVLAHVTAIDPATKETFSWDIRKMEDILLIQSYLRDPSPLPEGEITSLLPSFRNEKIFEIRKVSKDLYNLPDLIVVSGTTLRTSDLQETVRMWHDSFGYARLAIQQQNLIQEDKARGLQPRPRY